MEYYARVVLMGENFHPVYQAMARLMLLARSNFVFNENPLAASDQLLVRTEQGLVRLRGEERTDLPAPKAAQQATTLKRTSFGATLLDLPTGAWSLDLSLSDAALSDDYSYFKLLKMPVPERLTDFEEVDLGLQRYVFARGEGDQLYGYKFSRGGWGNAVPLAGAERFVTVDPHGRPGIYVIKNDSSYCALQPARLTCEHAPLGWPRDAARFVRFRDTTLKLNRDGQVVDTNGQLYPPLADVQALDVVVIPKYNVFE